MHAGLTGIEIDDSGTLHTCFRDVCPGAQGGLRGVDVGRWVSPHP